MLGADVLEHHPGLTDHVGRTIVVGIRPENLEDAAFAGGGSEGRTISAAVDIREDMDSEVFLQFAVDAAPVRDRGKRAVRARS